MRGFIIIALVIAGIGLGILGWAESESVHVAEIKPLSQAIHVANNWIWFSAVPGVVMIITGFALLASGWGASKK
jgi:hypothetical protein